MIVAVAKHHPGIQKPREVLETTLAVSQGNRLHMPASRVHPVFSMAIVQRSRQGSLHMSQFF